MSDIPTRSFEECADEIVAIIEKKRYEWTFKASVMEDFDDVKIEILAHIWKKWNLYDQSRPLGGWVATIVRNQFGNKLRDIYQSTSSPCLRCPCNTGGDGCSLWGFQGVDCELFKKWYLTKRHSHDVRLPVPMENHINEVHQKPDAVFNIDGAINGFHGRIQKVLTNSEWEIYRRLFVENKSDEETASELGFKTSEKGRKMGYKRIRQVKTIIVTKARKLLKEEGVEAI